MNLLTEDVCKPHQYRANSLEQLKEIAATLGCELYVGADDELLLDLDAGQEPVAEILSIVREKFGIKSEQRWISRSGTGIHVVIKMDGPLPPAERIALQAALGSDPKRESIAIWEWILLKTSTISLFRPVVP